MYDNQIKGEFNEHYKYAFDFWSPFIKNAQIYTMAASGYTWTYEEIKQLVKEGREPIEFNIMRRPLQFFSGYLRDNINSIVYGPVEDSDQKTADQFTKIGDYIWDKGNGFPVFLDACDEAFKSGISLVGIQKSFKNDFINGDTSFYKRTYNSFLLDPTFENIDLNDCSFAIMRDLVSKQQAKEFLPDVDPKEIDQLQNSFRDDKFLTFHPQFTTLSRNRNIIAYDQYYKRVTRKRKFLIDKRSSFYRDITDYPSDEIDKLKTGIDRFNKLYDEAEELGIDREDIPLLEIRNVNRGFVDLHILLNGQEVYCGDDPTGINETYPFVPIICYMEPSIWLPEQRLQGIASTMWSNQRQFNKRHMKIIDMMDSDISTGFKYLIGAVADPQDLQQSGQNKMIGIDPENAPQGLDSIQQLQGGGANPALIEYQSILDQLSLTLSNVNESVIGIDEKGNTQISGRLAQVRIAQGLRGNRKIFDQVETSQQLLAGLILIDIQKNYPAGKIERIIGEKPTQQFYDQEFEQYDAVIKEGIRSKSQKDAYYYELVNLKRDGIVDVPQDEIVRALQMTGLSDLEEAIKKQQELVAEERKKLDAIERSKLELENSQKEENIALAQERRARVVADLALGEERVSEAAENRAQAALARAKAIVEISALKDERILRVLEFVNTLERQEKADQDQVSQKVFDKSDAINTETEGSAENKQMQMLQQQAASQELQQETNLLTQ